MTLMDRDKAVEEARRELERSGLYQDDIGADGVLNILWRRAQEAEREEIRNEIQPSLHALRQMADRGLGRFVTTQADQKRWAEQVLEPIEEAIRNLPRSAAPSEEPKP